MEEISRDFDDFGYIVVMDDENYKNITWQAKSYPPYWGGAGCETFRKKDIRMADYFIKYKGRTSVP